MSWTHTVADKVRRGEPLSPPLDLMLGALTPVTRFGMWARKLSAPVRVDARVISVGNLTAGGTGKTPAVIRHLDALSADKTNAVAVLTRGYGTGNSRGLVASTDVSPHEHCRILGDEPALMLRKHPQILVIKGRDRVAAAALAIGRHGCNVLVLDDGFQYVQLDRDINQLVVDATNAFGNRRLLPRGILREPLSAMARATEVLLTRCDQCDDVSAVEEVIRCHTDAPIVRTVHRPVALIHLESGEAQPVDALEGRNAVVASAIGNPEAFRRTVESIGVGVMDEFIYRDHGSIRVDLLPTDTPVIVTEKDAVKIVQPPENLYALSVALELCD